MKTINYCLILIFVTFNFASARVIEYVRVGQYRCPAPEKDGLSLCGTETKDFAIFINRVPLSSAFLIKFSDGVKNYISPIGERENGTRFSVGMNYAVLREYENSRPYAIVSQFNTWDSSIDSFIIINLHTVVYSPVKRCPVAFVHSMNEGLDFAELLLTTKLTCKSF